MRGALLFATIALAGCGDSTVTGADLSGGDMSMPPDLQPPADMAISVSQGCTDYATAFCNKVQMCAPAFIQLVFGDLATCIDRFKLQCLPVFTLKNTSATIGQAEQCVAAIANITCDDVLTGAPPAPCAPIPGMGANGTACADDAQCMSAACVRQGGCGTCGTPPKAGESCANLGCAKGLFCGPNTRTCVAYGQANAMCDADHKCVASLACKGNKTSGTCSLPLKVGDTCDTTAGDNHGCNGGHGDYCNPFTKKCETVGFAKTGEECGLVNAAFVACEKGGICRPNADLGMFTGICIGVAGDGMACDPQNGPGCLSPAYCGGGVCKLFDPAVCM
jgi:hypothetical protein